MALVGHQSLVKGQAGGEDAPEPDPRERLTGGRRYRHQHSRRRRHLRALSTGQVSVSAHDQSPRQLQVVDLSQGGVRVALRGPTDLGLDEYVTVEVHLEDGAAISARGKVIRVDTEAGHAVVRFEDLSSEHGTRIDRYVLLHLTPVA